MRIITLGRRRRWHLWSHVWVMLRNRGRKVMAYVGVLAFLAVLLWSMAGYPGLAR